MPFQVWSANHPRGNFWELSNADSGGPAQIYSIQNFGQSLRALHRENPAPAPVASQRQRCSVTEVGFGKLPELTMPSAKVGPEDPQVFSFQRAAPWPGDSWGWFSGSKIASVVSNSMRPRRRQATRLPRPWDSPGKNTGVGCHFLLQGLNWSSYLDSYSPPRD